MKLTKDMLTEMVKEVIQEQMKTVSKQETGHIMGPALYATSELHQLSRMDYFKELKIRLKGTQFETQVDEIISHILEAKKISHKLYKELQKINLSP